jgi:membrane glycosyltransferase
VKQQRKLWYQFVFLDLKEVHILVQVFLIIFMLYFFLFVFFALKSIGYVTGSDLLQKVIVILFLMSSSFISFFFLRFYVI